MIDLHSHVLPGIDDGPATLEGSLELARAAAAAGTTTLVATPHITWDLPNTGETVADGVAALQPAFDEAEIPIRIRTGGELAVSKAVELPDDELRAIVAEGVAEAGATSPKDMGAVMKVVMPRVDGRADGRRVSAAVKEVLAG